MDGLEPPTLFLQGICTTIVLHRLIRDAPKKGDLNETKKKKERHGLRFMDRILQSTVNSAMTPAGLEPRI